MKLSSAALPFLILAAALGHPAHASLWRGSSAHDANRRGDCCSSYTQQFDCLSMKDYFLTSSECAHPAVVFIVKLGQEICANPYSRRVKFCMEDLDAAKKQGKKLVEEKLQ